MGIVSSDPKTHVHPKTHVRKLKAIQAMGASAVMVMNCSGSDPHGFFEKYREEVLPELRG